MFGLESLDVLIGLITVYLTIALACTVIVEAISSFMNERSKKLEEALKEFLAGSPTDNERFVKSFYDHPLVQALSKDKDGRPSYIPSEIVSQVILSLITANDVGTSLKNAVASLPGTVADNRIKGLLTTLAVQANNNVADFRQAVEAQFDAVMDRASGWFKRHQQIVALIVSAVFVIFANVDTFALVTSLSSSPELRAKMVSKAEQQFKKDSLAASAKDDAGGISTDKVITPDKGQQTGGNVSGNTLAAEKQKCETAYKAYDAARVALETGGIQFGWKEKDFNLGWGWFAKVIGLLISIFAISLGAPFWFDTLQRAIQVRQTGVSPDDKKKKG
jgi:hypothetical protein